MPNPIDVLPPEAKTAPNIKAGWHKKIFSELKLLGFKEEDFTPLSAYLHGKIGSGEHKKILETVLLKIWEREKRGNVKPFDADSILQRKYGSK